MLLKFKRLDERAQLPKKARTGDAGYDIVATDRKLQASFVEYSTGLAVEIPPGHVGLLFPRSSITNTGLLLKNSVGVLDSGYRGEFTFRFTVLDNSGPFYLPGERVGQLVIVPCADLEPTFVEELSSSERGTGGYGSTGA
jgi:dUTP pyrophosphatase